MLTTVYLVFEKNIEKISNTNHNICLFPLVSFPLLIKRIEVRGCLTATCGKATEYHLLTMKEDVM